MKHLLTPLLALTVGQLAGTGTAIDKPTAAKEPAYLATCPIKWASTTTATATTRRSTVRLWVAKRHLVARQIAAGKWAVTGQVGSRDALEHAGCTIAEYKDLDSTSRASLRDHLTCCGEMTWRGRTYYAWPCSWAGKRAIKVVKDGGTGPGVTAGQAACPAVAVKTP